MKKLALLFVASVMVTVASSQVVTIKVTQLADNVGYSELSPAQILLDTSLEIPSADAYEAFSYENDFTNKVLILKNELNILVNFSSTPLQYLMAQRPKRVAFAILAQIARQQEIF